MATDTLRGRSDSGASLRLRLVDQTMLHKRFQIENHDPNDPNEK